MAIYRQIHTSFWSDPFIASLTPEQKYFFLYLLTNEKTRQCGVYEITKRQMAFDTGYNIDTIDKLLGFFSKKGKIVVSPETDEILIVNWLRYNGSKSPKVQSCIEKERLLIKNTILIQYPYSIDTASQEEQEEEQEEEENKNKAKIDIFIENELKKDFDSDIKEQYRLMWDMIKDVDAKHLITIPKPLTLEQYAKLRVGRTASEVNDVIKSMMNAPGHFRGSKAKVSFYLTANDWLKIRTKPQVK